MSTTVTRSLAGVGVLLASALALTGCAAEWSRDAPRAAADEISAARVIQMPDGFSNIATKCVDGLRYSTIYHYSSSEAGGSYGALSVVADPACPATAR